MSVPLRCQHPRQRPSWRSPRYPRAIGVGVVAAGSFMWAAACDPLNTTDDLGGAAAGAWTPVAGHGGTGGDAGQGGIGGDAGQGGIGGAGGAAGGEAGQGGVPSGGSDPGGGGMGGGSDPGGGGA